MAKYLVETYYTCTFKVNHFLDDINESELKNLEQRDEYFETVKNEKIRKAKEEVEKLKAEMENLPDKVESENKITELRDIMDERDKFINEAELQAKTQEQAQASDELTQNTQAQEVVQENVATELAGTDPWLQRKQESSEQSTTEETVVESTTEQVVEESSEQVVEEVN